MAKTTETKVNEVKITETVELERAPEPIPFLKGEFFRGLCEIAAACKTGDKLFIPLKTNGIFQSLYYKRVFARKQNEDTSYTVGDFQMKNRYLYNYNKVLNTYDSIKEDNVDCFLKTVADIVKNKNYTIFSLKPVPSLENIGEIVGV